MRDIMRSIFLGVAALLILASSGHAVDAAQTDSKVAQQPNLVDQKNSAPHQSAAVSAAEMQIMSPLFGNTLVYSSDVPADVLHKVYNADHTWVSWYPQARPNRGISYSAPHHRGT